MSSVSGVSGTGPLEFSAVVRHVREVPVVEVGGEIDLATVPDLLEAVDEAGSQTDGLAVVVVDLRSAQFIDAFGTRALVERAQAMRRLGGDLRVVVPEEGLVARVFGILGICRTLSLYHDVAEPTGPEAG